ncbi:MAG: penicillin-binding protein 1A, partial [Armatimonadetes bacterium]|nr:penicillin-binding protein 1A [Armatimonadota bacterium]
MGNRSRRAHGQSAWRRLRRVGRPLGWILTLLVLLAFVAAGSIGGVALAVARQLPDVSALYTPSSEATRIYAANGELIASLYQENRETIPLNRIPLHLQQAVIAVEDARFYQHRGFDPRGMLRAALRNLLSGEILEGGSTITQQLARNLFLTQQRALSRKVAEIILAVEIERRLTKDEILERYLNQVYFGQGAYGVEMAAQIYFGKPAAGLTVAESAMLGGMIRAPSVYSPHDRFRLAKQRQEVVLDRMVDQKFLTREQAAAVRREPIRLAQKANAGLMGIRAPYFVSSILPMLLERHGEANLYRGGLQIHTTLDMRLQELAEKAVRTGVEEGKKLGFSQGALVALDPRTGEIRAMIGGYDFRQSQFNRAWQARRQPGSAFKPFIYITALARGIPPTRVLEDELLEYRLPDGKMWKPNNYDQKFRGPVTMRTAVEQSINIPAVRMLMEIGPARAIETAKKMGIQSEMQPVLALALGAADLTPLEITSAYGVLANRGVRAEPVAIAKVVDRQGRVLEEHVPKRQVAVGEDVAYLMTDLLKGVILRGTARAADIGRPAAGKTGTTDDYRNAWFIGYTPRLVAGVWVGNDDNSPMKKVTGGMVPAKMWAAFMKEAVKADPPEDWPRPGGVVEMTTCGTPNLAPGETCPNPRRELFLKTAAPKTPDGKSPAPGPPDQPASPQEPAPTPAAAPPSAPDPTRRPDDRIEREPPRLEIVSPSAQRVKAPFTIAGVTLPEAPITLTVAIWVGEVSGGTTEHRLTADPQGRFNFLYRPHLRHPGSRYVITVSAATPRG